MELLRIKSIEVIKPRCLYKDLIELHNPTFYYDIKENQIYMLINSRDEAKIINARSEEDDFQYAYSAKEIKELSEQNDTLTWLREREDRLINYEADCAEEAGSTET